MEKGIKYNGPMRFAHRGLVQKAPENTLGAFQAAVDFGCEGIELDIRLSKDGEIFVVHDKDLNRLSDSKVPWKICELTSEELKRVEIAYAGHLLRPDPPVPYSESVGSVSVYSEQELEKFREEDKRVAHLMTFEEFDKWFETVENDMIIEIEFCDPGSMPRMYEILSKSKNCSRYILFSGDRQINDEIQDYLREHGKPHGLRLGANIRCVTEQTMEFVNGAELFEVGLNDRKFTVADAEMLYAKGINIFSNLGDYPEWWQTICDLKLMGFKTNYAESYTEWWNNNKRNEV